MRFIKICLGFCLQLLYVQTARADDFIENRIITHAQGGGRMHERQTVQISILTLVLFFFLTQAEAQVSEPYDCQTGQLLTAPQMTNTFDPALYPVGNYSTPLNSSWIMSPGTIAANTFWTTASTKYAMSNDLVQPANSRNLPVLESKTCSRDMEVDLYTRNGYAVLRRTDAGRGIFFRFNGEVPGGEVQIGIVEGDTNTTYLGTQVYYTLTNLNILSRVPTYVDNPTDGHYLTFGVEGFDIYVKYNGTEFIRFKEYRHMTPGRLSVKTEANAGYGVRKTVIRHLANKVLLSNYLNNSYDLTDFGLAQKVGVGSITAATKTFTLNAAPSAPFKKGDFVIIETGGEAGLGIRGTVGVGGTWPQKSYPDEATLLADTTPIDGTYAWVVATGKVWRRTGGVWQAQLKKDYYIFKANPLALKAKVKTVDATGLILTLNTAAVVTATNATIYHDNAPIINKMMRSPFYDGEMNWPVIIGNNDWTAITPVNSKIKIPIGTFAVGSPIVAERHSGWRLLGNLATTSKLFSPRGVPSLNLNFYASPGAEVGRLHLQGNARNQGFGLLVTETDVPQGSAYPWGLRFSPGGISCDNSSANDLIVTDVFWMAVGSSFCTNVWARRVTNYMTEGLRMYVQWQFQWADSVDGGCEDCRVESPTLLGGFEAFKSVGTQFLNNSGVNAVVSANASGSYLFDNLSLTITSGANNGNDWYSPHNPMININTNIGSQNVSLGGTIRNATLVQQGYLNTIGTDHDNMIGIVVNANNPDIQILGGSHQAPNYSAPTVKHGVVGVNSTGLNTLVDGFTVHGTTDGFYGNLNVDNGIIRNCSADTIRYKASGVTVQNCTGTLMPY